MNSSLCRRRFLRTATAGLASIASPAIARTEWVIRGSERGRLRLVFYTDVHARLDRGVPEALQIAARAIDGHKPDLALCGGDLIAGGFWSTADQAAPRWDIYAAMTKGIGAEHRAVIGNHDLVGARPGGGAPPAADPRRDFRRHLGVERTYGSFDALGYRIMLLDSVCLTEDEAGYRGCVPPEQIDWIRQDLSRVAAGTPIIIVSHMPLLTGFFGATEGATAAPAPNFVVVNSTEVLELFAGHNLVLVLQGHLHVSELIRWRGTTFLTGGAVCANWWRGPYHGVEEGFNVIALEHDRVEWSYVPYAWDARPEGN